MAFSLASLLFYELQYLTTHQVEYDNTGFATHQLATVKVESFTIAFLMAQGESRYHFTPGQPELISLSLLPDIQYVFLNSLYIFILSLSPNSNNSPNSTSFNIPWWFLMCLSQLHFLKKCSRDSTSPSMHSWQVSIYPINLLLQFNCRQFVLAQTNKVESNVLSFTFSSIILSLPLL